MMLKSDIVRLFLIAIELENKRLETLLEKNGDNV